MVLMIQRNWVNYGFYFERITECVCFFKLHFVEYFSHFSHTCCVNSIFHLNWMFVSRLRYFRCGKNKFASFCRLLSEILSSFLFYQMPKNLIFFYLVIIKIRKISCSNANRFILNSTQIANKRKKACVMKAYYYRLRPYC